MIEIVLIGVGLSADAFAVSLVTGINENVRRNLFKKAFVTSLAFGMFQMIMPVLGFFLGNRFGSVIEIYGKLLTLGILGFIGVKTSIGGIIALCKPKDTVPTVFTAKTLFLQALATSIDAFAVGISFAATSKREVFIDAAIIGIVTFAICFKGVIIGGIFRSAVGEKLGHYAEIAGGLILASIGVFSIMN